MDTAMSPASQELPVQPSAKPDALHNGVPYDVSAPVPKLHKALSLQFWKQRWPVLSDMFGNSDKNQLPPVDKPHTVAHSKATTTQHPSNEHSPRV